MNPAILSIKDFSATDSGLRVSPIGRLKRRCGDSLEDIFEYEDRGLTGKQFPRVLRDVSSCYNDMSLKTHLNR